jgi:hypothetical protein
MTEDEPTIAARDEAIETRDEAALDAEDAAFGELKDEYAAALESGKASPYEVIRRAFFDGYAAGRTSDR